MPRQRRWRSLMDGLAHENIGWWRDSFLAAGSEPVSDSRADFAKILRDDIRRYAEIIRAAKIELQ